MANYRIKGVFTTQKGLVLIRKLSKKKKEVTQKKNGQEVRIVIS